MSLQRIYKLTLVYSLIVLGSLALATPAAAQQDSTVASITAAADTAAAQADTGIAAASPTLISTDVDTAALFKTSVQPAKDYSDEYRSAAYYTLWFLLFCVFIGIIGKALKVYELTREVQGKVSKTNWNYVQGVLFAVALVVGLYGTYWSFVHHGAMSMTESASVHGEEIDFMFNVTLIITTIVFIITHILLFGFPYLYSGSSKRKAYFYPHNNALERLWTIVPAIALTVLVLLGFFTWRNITNISPEDQKKAISIEITGEQFKWNVRYAGADNQLGVKNYKLINPNNNLGIDFTDKKSWDDKLAGEIYIPVNRPVRFTINSKDILHSFYLPDFRAQINAVPGMPTYFQFTPRFTTEEFRERIGKPNYDFILLCAKICGEGHYNMQYKVKVVSDKEYQMWLLQQPLYYTDEVKKTMQAAETKKAEENTKLAIN